MRSKLKIAILGTRGIPNNFGGFEQCAEKVGIYAASMGHDVTVYNPNDHSFDADEWKGITPHHLKVLHVLIIRFQNTKLVLHTVPMERPPQQDSHRCCHERAAGCPPPLFAAWAATGF